MFTFICMPAPCTNSHALHLHSSDFVLQDDDLPIAQVPHPPPLARIISEPILRYMQSNNVEKPTHKSSVHSLQEAISRRSSIDTQVSEVSERRKTPPSLGNIGRSVSSVSFLSTYALCTLFLTHSACHSFLNTLNVITMGGIVTNFVDSIFGKSIKISWFHFREIVIAYISHVSSV
jgi:hypothetical protein